MKPWTSTEDTPEAGARKWEAVFARWASAAGAEGVPRGDGPKCLDGKDRAGLGEVWSRRRGACVGVAVYLFETAVNPLQGWHGGIGARYETSDSSRGVYLEGW